MERLVKKAKRGDAEAFIQLMEACRMTMQRVAFGYLSNAEDVADAIQDTILDAFEHIGELKQSRYFKTWLVRILINNCNGIYRRNQKSIGTDYLEERLEQEADLHADEGDYVFYEMIKSLPEDSRTIFQLYFGEEFTTREIAEILHMNENTVKSRIRRGKEQLRAELQLG